MDHDLAFTCKRHQSLLRRKLGDSDPRLQENKIVNLRIAVPCVDGLILRPGETFSFWRCVGAPVASRGFVEGLQLSQGEVRAGVGGGLCQLANLLYWMSLHTPLEMVERHHHSFDPFPDDRRTLPFGSGAGVFYNYVDLRFRNPTDRTFQLRVWLTEEHLRGRIACDRELPSSYRIQEREHRFVRKRGRVFRTNELWRRVVDRKTGDTTATELLMRNFAEVKYPVPQEELDRCSRLCSRDGS